MACGKGNNGCFLPKKITADEMDNVSKPVVFRVMLDGKPVFIVLSVYNRQSIKASAV